MNLKRLKRRRVVVSAGALIAAAMLSLGSTSAVATTGGHSAVEHERLRVMTLNIFYGGDDLDLKTGDFCATPNGCPQTLVQIERAVTQARADIVGVQEPERNVERIASALGWYGSDRAHVMSRFPIIDPPGSNGLYVYVEVAPGRVVAVANTHLPSDPYGPYLVRDGGTVKQVLDLERKTRLPAVQDLVKVLPALARKGIPVMLTGDFNSPSHLDWTPAVAAERADVPYAVKWPASSALAAAGLRDTYREAHPDPVAVPGFTWTPGSPEADAHEVFDRIDWVLTSGPTRTIDSTVVGEKGGPDVGVGVSPWPTDHRGVVSTLDVVPAVPQVLVSPATRRVTIGKDLPVAFHAAGRQGERVELRDAKGRAVTSRPTKSGRTDGTVTLPTKGLRRGAYAVALVSRGKVVSKAPVWLYPAGEPTKVSVGKSSYKQGESIKVDWSNAPGMGLDWVSVYACPGGKCQDTSEYLVYTYTGSAIEGQAKIGPKSIGADSSWPLPPGRYVVRLLPDDGVVSVAQSAMFTVTK
ncbi:endonuclease/exonuclease/phosphatase family protein [Planotetraspora silvatica]|uniref:endonuclease/exonuclease/phosphatase family protein n=1 Tax=Planotetraspora silvatica TaxID=234614 RepID=UPI0019503BF4|nr:endonuclease/exonuclease/phosphatase family protein [Planotetraspora silvatica]